MIIAFNSDGMFISLRIEDGAYPVIVAIGLTLIILAASITGFEITPLIGFACLEFISCATLCIERRAAFAISVVASQGAGFIISPFEVFSTTLGNRIIIDASSAIG